VSIARAVLADPTILILDEATASLDSESEAMIQDGLKKLRKGRTSFVIAHRLSTIRSADQILVLEKGEVVERGTHAELLALGGRYRELYDRQYHFEEDRFVNPGEDWTPEPAEAARARPPTDASAARLCTRARVSEGVLRAEDVPSVARDLLGRVLVVPDRGRRGASRDHRRDGGLPRPPRTARRTPSAVEDGADGDDVRPGGTAYVYFVYGCTTSSTWSRTPSTSPTRSSSARSSRSRDRADAPARRGRREPSGSRAARASSASRSASTASRPRGCCRAEPGVWIESRRGAPPPRRRSRSVAARRGRLRAETGSARPWLLLGARPSRASAWR
jgi:hypothetical protein